MHKLLNNMATSLFFQESITNYRYLEAFSMFIYHNNNNILENIR